jgi:hypothetical protein
VYPCTLATSSSQTLFVGLGLAKNVTAESWTALGATATAAAQKHKCASVAIGKYYMVWCSLGIV